jgi:hypothetical protein
VHLIAALGRPQQQDRRGELGHYRLGTGRDERTSVRDQLRRQIGRAQIG